MNCLFTGRKPLFVVIPNGDNAYGISADTCPELLSNKPGRTGTKS